MPEEPRPPAMIVPGAPGVDQAQTTLRLAYARAAFLTTGNLESIVPRPIVRDSWRRCRDSQVDVLRQIAAPGVSSDDQLAHLRASSAALMAAARPVLKRISEALADIGYVVAIGDIGARLLEICGRPDMLRQLARRNFLPGSDWSETVAGTNAIGTALATGRVVQLTAAEHYCEGWQDVTCTSAPIRSPTTGALLGALDITGDYRLARPFLATYLAAAARAIEQNLGDSGALPAAQRLWPGHTVVATETISTEQRRTRLAERLAVAAGMISASLNPATTAARIAEHAALVLEAHWAAVYRFDDEGVAQIAAQHGPWPPGQIVPEALGGEIAALRDWGEPALIAELPRASRALPAGARSAALLPLMAPHGLRGAMLVLRPARGLWHADDVRAGLTLAAQAATALENADLVAQLQEQHRQTQAMNTLGSLLGSMVDPYLHSELIIDMIVDLTGFDYGAALCFAPSASAPCRATYSAGLRALGLHAEAVVATLRCMAVAAISARDDVVGGDGSARGGVCDLIASYLDLSSGPCVLVVGRKQHRAGSANDHALLKLIGQQLALTLRRSGLVRAVGEQEGLIAADQLKSDFLAAISHDLRSPLTALRATVESLIDRRHSFPPAEHEGMLLHVGRQVGRISRLIDQMLDLSQIEAGIFRIDHDWTDLGVLIDDTICAFARLDQGHPISPRLAADLPLQYIDPDRITQVLWNLLENAAKYSPAAAPITVAAHATPSGTVIDVADRGPGVPEDQREQIFGHFYRMPKDRRARVPGSGLGLAICRGIIRAHGGDIWVESRAGGGSLFRLCLPPPPAEPAAIEEVISDELCPPRTGD
ncbi:GAF domain-containing protein [Chloroflexales bacterium ZM16-3]|nr:GAF domain-containing protein [Chloroflexales bacterium ZM16-3]